MYLSCACLCMGSIDMSETEKKTGGRDFGTVARWPLCLSGSMSPNEVRAGNLTEGKSIQKIFDQLWWNTFRLRPLDLGKPTGPVTWEKNWEVDLGWPMKQEVPGTCVIVATTKCVEAVSRHEYEKVYGKSTFPWAAQSCKELYDECCNRTGSDGHPIWKEGEGAMVSDVLDTIIDLGGVLVTASPPLNQRLRPLDSWRPKALYSTQCLLPLRSWKMKLLYDWKSGDTLVLPEQLDELLRAQDKPFIVQFWVTPWYDRFKASSHDASRDRQDAPAYVYRGCGLIKENRCLSEFMHGNMAGPHVAVCVGCRLRGNQWEVKISDNHESTGPLRWIDADELEALYTLECVAPEPDSASG